MKKPILLLLTGTALLLLYTNCSDTAFVVSNKAFGVTSLGSTTTTGSTPFPTATPVVSTGSVNNVLAVTVGCGYVNEPCVTVTICVPGTSTCQTIPNVLLDTGSYGLRLFSSVVTIPLVQETDPANSSHSVAECVAYADGSGQWGPVKKADIVLSGEKASAIPIQIVDSTYPGVPSNCTNLDSSPSATGFNGILGVGLFVQDCGPGCESVANNGIYYSCAGATCSGMTISVASQVANPVAFFAADNNGVILELPAISDAGALTLNGSLVFGIGTQSDNSPSAAAARFAADGYGNFKTTFSGTSYSGFIDSGSNGLYFPSSSITACTGSYQGFYCPASTMSFSAIQMSSSSTNPNTVSFEVANGQNELQTSNPNMVFNNLAGAMASDFDWGLPFFFGRNIFVGIEGKSSAVGTGPYWAY